MTETGCLHHGLVAGLRMSISSSDVMHCVGVDVRSGSGMRSHWTPTSVMEVLMLTLTPNVHKKEILNLQSIACLLCTYFDCMLLAKL